jgi:hypothetical protein
MGDSQVESELRFNLLKFIGCPMAKIQIYPAGAPETFYFLFFDESTFRIRSETKTEITFADRYGASVALTGSGFRYDHGDVVAGVVNSAIVEDKEHNILFTVKYAHLDAGAVCRELEADPVIGMLSAFKTKDDKIIGSKLDDSFMGLGGDDVLYGKAGDDQLSGRDGTDTLFGGAGNDTFFYATRDYDKEIIADFQDYGDLSEGHQDKIVLNRSLWHHMEVHQVGKDVVLDFGSADQIVIENFGKRDLGREDFQLVDYNV